MKLYANINLWAFKLNFGNCIDLITCGYYADFILIYFGITSIEGPQNYFKKHHLFAWGYYVIDPVTKTVIEYTVMKSRCLLVWVIINIVTLIVEYFQEVIENVWQKWWSGVNIFSQVKCCGWVISLSLARIPSQADSSYNAL